MSDKPTLQGAKRRYKILKRCDQSDSAVSQEIKQLESWYPELSAQPVKELSAATRATLEGGALVTAIEKEGEQKQQNQNESSSENNTAASSQEDEVRQKLQELNEMTKRLSADIKSEKENIQTTQKEISGGEQKHQQDEGEKQKQQNQQQQQVDQLFNKAFTAIHAYDSFYSFPKRCNLSKVEVCFAIFSAVFCSLYHAIVFQSSFSSSNDFDAATSSSSSSLTEEELILKQRQQLVQEQQQQINSGTLCDTKALLTNPILWCLIPTIVSLVQNNLAAFQKISTSSKNSSNSGSNFVTAINSTLSAIVRFIFSGIIAFTFYSVLCVCLQASGSISQFPARFCSSS